MFDTTQAAAGVFRRLGSKIRKNNPPHSFGGERVEKIQIGQVVNVVGLKGEVKVVHHCDAKERFAELTRIFVGDAVRDIEAVRYQKNLVVLKLAGIDDRTAAEAEKGKPVFIDAEALRELPEDAYYVRDLIGLSVFDETGARLGRLSDVVSGRAQDLYEIETENKKKFLIPAVQEFITQIDIESGTMHVTLIEGMME